MLLLSSIALIGALLVGRYFISSTKHDLDLQNTQYLRELAIQNAGSVKNTVHMQLDKLEALANVIGSQPEFSLDFTMQVLKAEGARASFKRVAYISPDGTAITTDGLRFSALDRAYYTKAMGGESSVSNRIISKLDGAEVNVYAAPLYHQGVLQGVIVATSEATLLADMMSASVFDGKGFTYLIQKDGTPIAFGESVAQADQFDNLFEDMRRNHMEESEMNAMQSNMESGKTGVIEYSRDSVSKVGAYTEVGMNDWYLFTVVPRAVIAENTDRLMARCLFSVISMVLLLGGLLLAIITQAYRSNQRLAHLAFSDPLTAGNNLNKFKLLTSWRIAQGREGFYMLRIDIDNFKLINDMYGYEEGNRILLDMDRLIAEILSTENIHGRSSSDNFFCLICENCDEDVIRREERFREGFRQMLKAEAKPYAVNFTSGVYKIASGDPDEDIDKIIDRATMAHRSAKQQENERKFAFYSESVWDRAIRVKNIEDDMHEALANGEFIVYLQPKYSLLTGQMEGAEALVRWLRDGRMLSPADFIPIFERNGFIVNMDLYVLEEVCRLQRRWLDMGLVPLPVSVNQSKPLVYDKDYVDKLYAMVGQYKLPPYLIELELLETLIHHNIAELELVTERLRALGFLVCIDDFGSGYSSLNMIKDVCADVLKIDREFLSSAENNERAEVVLRNIIELAKGLHMSVITEGVETREQAELLKRLSCDTAQGFLYARPMPASDYEAKLQRVPEVLADPVPT